MTGVVIGIATGTALLGFFLGVQSKAVAKRKSIDKERKQVESLGTITHRNAPPPPPPRASKKETSYKHMKPSMYYSSDTFVETNYCKNCRVIGYKMDIATYRPCPKCGGKIKGHAVCKWDQSSKTWVKTTAQ